MGTIEQAREVFHKLRRELEVTSYHIGKDRLFQLVDAGINALASSESVEETNLVTHESALQAIEHVSQHNGPGRETEALKMLVSASHPVEQTADTQAEAMKLLDEIIADLDLRARIAGDVEDGKAVLNLSNGLLTQYYALKSSPSPAAGEQDPNTGEQQ